MSTAHWQTARYQPGQRAGHYESWFLRANHPTRPLAFWLRHTLFVPEGRPEAALGELWAVCFDGERGDIHVGKHEQPLQATELEAQGLGLRVGEAHLAPGRAQGRLQQPQPLRWDLRYEGGEAPLLLLPRGLYAGGFPKAKSVVPRPLVRFNGTVEVGGESWPVVDWVGSENHNWGRRHTDAYAWGQVAGFDNDPAAFLEVISARLRVGPWWTPPLTLLVLRLDGREYRFNSLWRAACSEGCWGDFRWTFSSRQEGVRITGELAAPARDFVALRYANPPGGAKTCLNSKIARCTLTVTVPGQAPRTLHTEHRAAFEILTDDHAHGLAVRA